MLRFNEQNEVIRQEDYRAILVGLQLERERDITESMDELQGLAEAAGITVLGRLLQARERPENATYLGKGKVEELEELCAAMEADTVVFNSELTGVQLRNLDEKLSVRIIDRTMLILDIFASRAVSREGKLQVELAQLQYRLPRLTGFGKTLSRLGGGIGTRGPGEKKLETDRRHINRRMDEIKSEIEELKQTRRTQRAKRERSGIPIVALVGYTNSGKSAMMNRFLQLVDKEEKSVTEKDMLFATLDTFQRSIQLDSRHTFLLIDTVGFVSRLPHTLVKAFKATLEEVTFADLLLHVVDSSSPDSAFHIEVTDQVLKEIGAGDKDRLLVYNKIDRVPQEERSFCEGQDTVCVSAKYGDNMDQLVQLIRSRLFSDRKPASLRIPFDRGDLVSDLQNRYRLTSVEYREDGCYLELELSPEDWERLAAFRI